MIITMTKRVLIGLLAGSFPILAFAQTPTAQNQQVARDLQQMKRLQQLTQSQSQRDQATLQRLQRLQQAQRAQQPQQAQQAPRPSTQQTSSSAAAAQLAQRAREQAALRQASQNNSRQISLSQAPPYPGNQTGQVGKVSGQGNGANSFASSTAVDEQAFRSMTKTLMPITPKQIVRLRQMYRSSQRAEQTEPGVPPKPTATSKFVSLAPGATPPTIRLAQGFVSSLVFLDSSGAVWPISDYDLGNPKAFNIQWDRKSNTLMIQANQLYTYGNLAVRLKGLATPVMLTLIPGQKVVDYRVDLRVQGFGPNAKTATLGQGMPNAASPVLLSVLDGVPPTGSRALAVTGGKAEAWLQGSRIFLRTRLTLLSPGWISTMTSADGTRVYELQKTPLLLVSWHGRVKQLKLEGL